MKIIYSIIKLLIVFTFVVLGIIYSIKGEYNDSLNGIIAGIALIEAFIIARYEVEK